MTLRPILLLLALSGVLLAGCPAKPSTESAGKATSAPQSTSESEPEEFVEPEPLPEPGILDGTLVGELAEDLTLGAKATWDPNSQSSRLSIDSLDEGPLRLNLIFLESANLVRNGDWDIVLSADRLGADNEDAVAICTLQSGETTWRAERLECYLQLTSDRLTGQLLAELTSDVGGRSSLDTNFDVPIIDVEQLDPVDVTPGVLSEDSPDGT